ncbi:hypothetical protein Tco_0280708 [Tanacetum coccineum]
MIAGVRKVRLVRMRILMGGKLLYLLVGRKVGCLDVARLSQEEVTERKRRMYTKFSKKWKREKRKLYRWWKGIKMVNELDLHCGRSDNLVVFYDARSKDLKGMLEKGRRLWVVEGLTLERCSTFGKKDKLELSYVGPFEILRWIGPMSRMIALVKVRWDSKRGPELTWERKDQMRSKCPQLFINSANASSS